GPDGKIFCKPFDPDGRAMWFQEKVEAVIDSFLDLPIRMKVDIEAGVLESRGPQEMRAYQGKGVGGGSLVNMALYLRPDREKLKSMLPMVNPDEFYNTYLPRAAEVLHAGSASRRLIDSEYYRYSRVGVAAAEQAGFTTTQLQSGYDFDYMELELDDLVPRSALDGEAGFGNNYGKRSLDKTYLADALGTGLLTIHALHVVKRIKTNPSGGYVVEVEKIDVLGNVLARKELTCSHLFVGAGSMATSELLVRARERGDLPYLNTAVGTKWGPNGDIFVALDNPLLRPTGAKQCTIPSHGFITRDVSNRRVVSEYVPLPMGIPIWQSFVIVIADNPEAGHFTYDWQTDTVDLQWTRSQNEPSVAAAKHVFDRVNSRAGTEYSNVLKFKDDSIFGDQVTYHPVGGVPLGEATDDYGRIREYPGLYVVDGSLIPIGIGANPSLSITALAERNIEHILATDLET
ncbi:MAG: GMC family oxidoreductase, partial [Polyangiaceae bacterium]|nr:GMC family oxidoreductase [Polyangiaceae bacterium]